MTAAAKVVGASWLALLFTSTCAFAQEPARDLKTQADLLRELAENLQGAGVVPPAAFAGLLPTTLSEPPAPAPDQAPDPTGSNQWLKSIKLSGFVDIAYTKNFNNPGNFPAAGAPAPFPPNTQNNARFFDTQGNSFLFNMGELMLEKVASADSVAGFRLKLGFGKDANTLSSTEGLGLSAQFDLVEGYAEFLMPVGSGLDFKIGKMATLAGYEVIESKDNWDYSRSLLFSWAIPLTHTGLRASYSFIDGILSATLGVMNGWNMIADNNNGKTLEFQISANPFPWLAALFNLYTGEEGQGNASVGVHRFVLDGDITITWNEWKLGWNGDFGSDQGASIVPVAGRRDEWGGNALYLKYQATHWYAPSLRGEYFGDNGGGVTGFGIASNPAGPFVGRMQIWEVTFENEVKINDNLLFRLEFRHDEANANIFLRGNAAGKRYQDTVAFETIFMF
jgi:hypothetical protein